MLLTIKKIKTKNLTYDIYHVIKSLLPIFLFHKTINTK